jgi:hypothetical protein
LGIQCPLRGKYLTLPEDRFILIKYISGIDHYFENDIFAK